MTFFRVTTRAIGAHLAGDAAEADAWLAALLGTARQDGVRAAGPSTTTPSASSRCVGSPERPAPPTAADRSFLARAFDHFTRLSGGRPARVTPRSPAPP
ncbi:MAG: hypothetical protein R3F59_28725 [Myxococcota bacterium]